MSRNLSQIVADLFARPAEGTELSAQIQRLGLEIRLVVQSEDTVFGKFRGLLESFGKILPDEKQRYQAALQALSTTSKLGRQEIIKAMNAQLEELKIIEKSVMPSLSSWRDELVTMEARSQGLKSELASLRARIAQLEGEEKTVQAAMAARQKDLEGAEKTIRELFANIGAEISAFNRKAEELTAEAPAAQPAPPAAPVAQPAPPAAQPAPPAEKPVPKKEPQKTDAPAKKQKDAGQKVEIQSSPPPADTKFQRKCPMCGGPFHLLELEKIWQCYTCAYEEPDR